MAMVAETKRRRGKIMVRTGLVLRSEQPEHDDRWVEMEWREDERRLVRRIIVKRTGLLLVGSCQRFKGDLALAKWEKIRGEAGWKDVTEELGGPGTTGSAGHRKPLRREELRKRLTALRPAAGKIGDATSQITHRKSQREGAEDGEELAELRRRAKGEAVQENGAGSAATLEVVSCNPVPVGKGGIGFVRDCLVFEMGAVVLLLKRVGVDRMSLAVLTGVKWTEI